MVTQERFLQGLSYEQFRAQMTRNQERFDTNEKKLEVAPSDAAAWKHLSSTVNILAIGEDWCGDVIDNLPIVGKLAQESDKVHLRVFLRDQNLDLIDQYLKEGKFRSIPAIVFFDSNFQELGRFIERPDSVTQRRAQKRRELFTQHPELGSPDAPVDQLPEAARQQLQQLLAEQRAELKATENQEVVSQLTAIVKPLAG